MDRIQILETAHKCVTKDRNATHGEPEDNFRAIADLQNAYLRAKARHVGMGENQMTLLSPTDIAVLNILQKVARIVTSPECPDHWIDIAGYAACGGGLSEPIAKKPFDATQR